MLIDIYMILSIKYDRRYRCLAVEEVKALLELHGCTYHVLEIGDSIKVMSDCEERVLCRAGTVKEVEGIGRLRVDRAAFSRHLARRGRIMLDPLIARVMVNLARVREGALVLDPFSGSGSILVEAAMVGARTVAMDINVDVLSVSRINLGHYGEYARADASQLPVRPRSVDAVITDVPYGRMSITHLGVRYIVRKVLDDVGTALKDGGYMVYAAPSYSMFHGHTYKYVTICSMYIHGGLYRDIVVLRND